MTALLSTLVMATLISMQTATTTPCLRIPHHQTVTVSTASTTSLFQSVAVIQVPASVFQIEYISVVLRPQATSSSYIYGTLIDTQVFGNRADHSIGPAASGTAPLYASPSFAATHGQQVHFYADASSEIRLKADVVIGDPAQPGGSLTWTVSGRLLVGACAVL